MPTRLKTSPPRLSLPGKCLIILTAIKDAKNGYLVSIHLERDYNAFSVAGYS